MWCTHLHIAWHILPPPWWFTFFYLLEYHAWIWRSITRASQKRHETHHLLGAPFSPNFHADGTGYQDTGMIELGGFLITWLEDSPRLHFGWSFPWSIVVHLSGSSWCSWVWIFWLLRNMRPLDSGRVWHSVGLVGNDHPTYNSKS